METRKHRKAKEKELSAKFIEKEIIFIRHGHSIGQAAPKHSRKTDLSLIDADLSEKGKSQAYTLRKTIREIESSCTEGAELVISSPLTRALKTALILFEKQPMIIHPSFAEIGGGHRIIPENRGRELEELLNDHTLIQHGLKDERVDFSLIKSSSWPVRDQKELNMIEFLLSRPEKRIVVVAHHNVIFNLLNRDTHAISYVKNCTPIHATLTFDGKLGITKKLHYWLEMKIDDDNVDMEE